MWSTFATFKTCGVNTNNQLGDGTAVSKSTPVTPSVGSSGTISDVQSFGDGLGGCHVLRSNGDLWAFGYQPNGSAGAPTNQAFIASAKTARGK